MSNRITRFLVALLVASLVPSVGLAEEGEPRMSKEASKVPHNRGNFRPDPNYDKMEYSVERQRLIYGGKQMEDARLFLGWFKVFARPVDAFHSYGCGATGCFQSIMFSNATSVDVAK